MNRILRCAGTILLLSLLSGVTSSDDDCYFKSGCYPAISEIGGCWKVVAESRGVFPKNPNCSRSCTTYIVNSNGDGQSNTLYSVCQIDTTKTKNEIGTIEYCMKTGRVILTFKLGDKKLEIFGIFLYSNPEDCVVFTSCDGHVLIFGRDHEFELQTKQEIRKKLGDIGKDVMALDFHESVCKVPNKKPKGNKSGADSGSDDSSISSESSEENDHSAQKHGF